MTDPGSPKTPGLAETVIALVPMRHHSERVPGKNFRLLGGRPLYAHILSALENCAEIGRIVVDTDSSVISEGVAREFPRVTLVERPEHLRGGEVATNEVLLHDVEVVPGRFYLQTHCTNPFVTASTLSQAVRAFLATYPQFDSLFGVTRLQKRLWDQHVRPINHDPAVLLRTQDLPPLFEENSCIYLFERSTLLARRSRLGANPRMFEMDALEAWDIDQEADFAFAEVLMQMRDAAKSSKAGGR
jgi:CMP-N-acetylneuraminic acid synthetase